MTCMEARPGAQQTPELNALDITNSPIGGGAASPVPARLSNQNDEGFVSLAKATGSPTGTVEIWPYLCCNRALVERFWSHVDRKGPDDCWDWRGSPREDYGRFKVAGASRQSNRVAWAIGNRRDPGNMLVRHTCDRPQCCNPAHLLLGTVKDNANDKITRGRHRSGRQDGEHNGHAILTAEQVGQIVQCFRDGMNNQQIARRFPVSDSLVSRIRVGRSWGKEAAAFGWQPRPLIRHPFCRLNKEQAA